MGILAGQRNDDAKTEPTYVTAERLHSQAETFTKVANVCFIAGGVILAAGVAWGILDVSAAKSRSDADTPTQRLALLREVTSKSRDR